MVSREATDDVRQILCWAKKQPPVSPVFHIYINNMVFNSQP